MIDMTLRFVDYLRFKGMTVSTSALHNAIDALKWIDILDREQVYYALESCLAQKIDDRKKFGEIFDKFFDCKSSIELNEQSVVFRLQVKEFTENMRKSDDYAARILADYIEGDSSGLMENIGDEDSFRIDYDQAGAGKGISKNKAQKKIMEKAKLYLEDVEGFVNACFHMSREERESLGNFLKEHLENAADLLSREKDSKASDARKKQSSKDKKRRSGLMPWEKQRNLSNISFDQITIDEEEKVKEEVEKIAQKLKDALSRQKRRATNGRIDIKNTIRNSLRFDAIPFNIKMRTPNRKKGKIIALCDISMSVAYAAQFMLLLLYRLQNRFTKIRTFVFIRDTYEISGFFEKHTLETALDKTVKHHNIALGQLTNYGQAFKSFMENYSDAINKNTTLLIMGDGLNNHNDSKVKYFKKMSEKAARTLWLNPEEQQHWHIPGSAIRDYLPFCSQMAECATLDQLENFATNLAL